MTLGYRLSSTASSYPGRTAIVFEGRKVSFRELEERSEGFAAWLNSAGIGRGDSVAILLPNCPEFAIAYFGTVKSGAAAVPLNTFLAAPELEYILKDSGARALVFSEAFKDRVEALGGRAENIELFIDGESLPVEAGRGRDAADDEDPAAILYTSGTTGRPKGAVLTHKNLLSNAAACAEMFKITFRDRFLLFLPMFHAFSFLVCMLLPVSVGASTIILSSVRPFSKVIKAVVFGRATLFVAIPPVYNLLSMKKFPRLVFRLIPLRLCVSGSAPLPAEALARFSRNFPVPLLEGYGLTEAAPVVSCNPVDRPRKPGSVGLPLPGVKVRVVDEEGAGSPPGRVGEITVKGDNVMKGYLHDEQATKEAIRDGWLYTGDLGYMDEEGYIYIVDRKKDLILVHGMNVYPREVEEALYQHPAVLDAAVIGVTDESHGEIPKAYIALREGAGLTDREVKEYLKGRLASYKVPRQVEFVESLPKTPTGKVLKRDIRKATG